MTEPNSVNENRTMLAAVLESPRSVKADPLTIMSIPIPRPKGGEVLIRVQTCGICRTDLHLVEGELPMKCPLTVPGHQIVGLIESVGPGVKDVRIGAKVGLGWLHNTCGTCEFCSSGRENLCDHAEYTGWTAQGGFAQYVAAPASFTYPLPQHSDAIETAPLLCGGIIGFRALRLTELDTLPGGWVGKRLGIYGFGSAGHVAIQLALGRGAEVFVCTRDREHHQTLAKELGATWVGGSTEPPPHSLDAAIIFAPAGELIPPALAALKKGGVLVVGGIHMTDVPSLPYREIYGERVIRSVMNNTREDGREFLAEAARLPVRTHVRVFPLDCVNEAMRELKSDQIKGAAILQIGV